ncbi:MAG: putative Na+/H+ antiporter [Chthoniobacterales bacterium]
MKPPKIIFLCLLLLAVFSMLPATVSAATSPSPENAQVFPRPIDSYKDGSVSSIWEKLRGRIVADPFNAVATGIFLLAICHTFLASKFLAISHHFERQYQALEDSDREAALGRRGDRLQFKVVLFHFLGEIEVVFGIWVIPLAIAITAFSGWRTMVSYINGVQYVEPIFVFVVMAIASSKPILRFAEGCLSLFARLGGATPAAWWVAILTVGPILGSFITEPAAMTICALLLIERFYKLQPSMRLRYATLGLLFVNISVGGTLTHFAAPPVVMVAGKWGWSMSFMFMNFGWHSLVGIAVSNLLFFAVFRKELLSLKAPVDERTVDDPVPIPVTIVHLLAIAWTVVNAHYPALLVFGLLFFLAFVAATDRHQEAIGLRSPMLVGFFLAALVIHGGCQQWWIAPVLGGLGKWSLMIGSTLLTAVNDNAAITYLATLVPGFTEELKHAVVAGAVAGGGLTVIANAPNPAGQSILQAYFGPDGIKPLGLLAAAIIPTIIVGAALMLL